MFSPVPRMSGPFYLIGGSLLGTLSVLFLPFGLLTVYSALGKMSDAPKSTVKETGFCDLGVYGLVS